ncbi:unnamed protein product [Prunus armeniaca]
MGCGKVGDFVGVEDGPGVWGKRESVCVMVMGWWLWEAELLREREGGCNGCVAKGEATTVVRGDGLRISLGVRCRWERGSPVGGEKERGEKGGKISRKKSSYP